MSRQFVALNLHCEMGECNYATQQRLRLAKSLHAEQLFEVTACGIRHAESLHVRHRVKVTAVGHRVKVTACRSPRQVTACQAPRQVTACRAPRQVTACGIALEVAQTTGLLRLTS